jgi:hypothetical protein
MAWRLRWPWVRRGEANGEAKQAGRDAADQLEAARDISHRVERTARAARELARRTDRFAMEIERAWRAAGGGSR